MMTLGNSSKLMFIWKSPKGRLYFFPFWMGKQHITDSDLELAQPINKLEDPQSKMPRPRPIALIIGTTVIFPVNDMNRELNTMHILRISLFSAKGKRRSKCGIFISNLGKNKDKCHVFKHKFASSSAAALCLFQMSSVSQLDMGEIITFCFAR